MQIVLHSNDPKASQRACYTRTQHGLVARCSGCGIEVLTPETPHIHLLYGRGKYEGYCSEGCAMRGAKRLGLI